MGRRKISITKLEHIALRKNTFNKRSTGIKKKVKEISVLSDGKVMLLTRSPKGEYDIVLGENNTFDDIIQQFLSESQEKRNKSWKRSMTELEKAFREDEQSFNALMDLGCRTLSTEKQGSQMEELKLVKKKISEIESRLGRLRNINEIDKIDSIHELTATKKLVLELLVKNEREKELFIVQQRSGLHNFTNPYIRDFRCSTRAADTANHYTRATDQQLARISTFSSPHRRVNLGYSASMGIPVTSYPCNSGNQQIVSMPDLATSSSQRISRGSTCTEVSMQTQPSIEGIDQTAKVVQNLCPFRDQQELTPALAAHLWELTSNSTIPGFSEKGVQEKMSELEKVITAKPTGFNERDVQEKISELEKAITADLELEPSGFTERDVQEQISELEKLIAAAPSGFSERDVIDQMSELEMAIVADPTGF